MIGLRCILVGGALEMDEDEIAMVRRHVALGEAHITRQHELISKLKSIGADTSLPEQLLTNFEETLMLHQQHLKRLERGSLSGR